MNASQIVAALLEFQVDDVDFIDKTGKPRKAKWIRMGKPKDKPVEKPKPNPPPNPS